MSKEFHAASVTSHSERRQPAAERLIATSVPFRTMADMFSGMHRYLANYLKEIRSTYALLRTALRFVLENCADGASVHVRVFFIDHVFALQKHPLRFSSRGAGLPDYIVSIPRRPEVRSGYATLHTAPLLEVRERVDSCITIQPIRWGLSDDEKRQLLVLARRSIEWLVRNKAPLSIKEVPRYFPERFLLPADVDVTVWMGGTLRGSRIVTGRSLWAAVAEAAQRACRDERFKPVTADDVPKLRIEIVVFSPLRVPVTEKEYREGRIDPSKGYVFARGGKEGWYVPPVHNGTRFGDLRDLVTSLIVRKAGATNDRSAYRFVSSFDVCDFIEFGDDVLSLWGPIPDPASFGNADRTWYFKAADSLCAMQEGDGNIPAVVDVLTGMTVRVVDWPRLAFTGCALAEFSTATGEEKYREAARRILDYIVATDQSGHLEKTSSYTLTLAYLVKLAHALSHAREQELQGRFERAASHSTLKEVGVLSAAHIAEVLLLSDDSLSLAAGERLREEIADGFARAEVFNPVMWAEAVALFFHTDRALALRIADRISASRLPISEQPHESPFSYTRSAGKMLEILSLEPERYAVTIQNLERWLQAMQYTEKTSYFIPDQVREKISGAIRHDVLDTNVWLDSAGHAIMAGARLMAGKQMSADRS